MKSKGHMPCLKSKPKTTNTMNKNMRYIRMQAWKTEEQIENEENSSTEMINPPTSYFLPK